MKKWKLIRRLTGLRFGAWIVLAAAVPTAGAALSCLAGLTPALLAYGLRLDSNAALFASVLFGMLAWLAAATGVALGALHLAKLVGRLRAPAGALALGADGVRWRELWRSGFVSWAEVARIELATDQAVVLHLADGRQVRFDLEQTEAFAREAGEALARYRAAGPTPEIAELHIGASDLRAWLARARQLLTRASYRDATVTPDLLVRVATDPRALPEQRIGSALALADAPEDVKARVRVAIDATADPDVAEAMDEALRAPARAPAIARTLDARRRGEPT